MPKALLQWLKITCSIGHQSQCALMQRGSHTHMLNVSTAHAAGVSDAYINAAH